MALALLFSGQGAQKVGMGKSLYDQSPAARAVFDEADRVLGWSLTKLCFEGPDTELTQTKVCQPALFVHGMAVLAALKEAGKLPEVKYALGLSLGEITAYTAAGVFDFGTGLGVVAVRRRLVMAQQHAWLGTAVPPGLGLALLAWSALLGAGGIALFRALKPALGEAL